MHPHVVASAGEGVGLWAFIELRRAGRMYVADIVLAFKDAKINLCRRFGLFGFGFERKTGGMRRKG